MYAINFYKNSAIYAYMTKSAAKIDKSCQIVIVS